MSQAKDQPLSEVVPLLVAALVCDAAVSDRSTGKNSLIGIFDTVYARKLPTEQPISLYLKMVDAEGYYRFDVRYVQVATGKVLANAEGKLTARNHGSFELHLPFPPLPIPAKGTYEFQIWANSMFLGSTSIKVVQERGG